MTVNDSTSSSGIAVSRLKFVCFTQPSGFKPRAYGDPVRMRPLVDEIFENSLPALGAETINPGNGPGIIPNLNRLVFQNSYEILGGCYEDRYVIPGVVDGMDNIDAIKEIDEIRGLFKETTIPADPKAGEWIFDGISPMQLFSEENYYLRSTMNNDNFQTNDFDTGTAIFPEVVRSQILAKIPIGNPLYIGSTSENYNNANPPVKQGESRYKDADGTMVTYYIDNGNNLYSILLRSTNETYLQLALTDAFGRSIPESTAEQLNCGFLSYTASFRIDVFED